MDAAKTSVKPSASARRKLPIMARFWRWEGSGVLVALVVLFAALALATDTFLSNDNLSVVARQAAFVGLVAVG